MNAADRFADFDALRDQKPTRWTPQIGDRFTSPTEYPWHDGEEKAVHLFVSRWEVVNVKPNGFDYKLVETLSETGRPAWSTIQPPHAGSMAYFAVDDYIALGKISDVEVDHEEEHSQTCEAKPEHSWRDCPSFGWDESGIYTKEGNR